MPPTANDTKHPKYLTAAEAKDVLGVTDRTIRNWARDGVLDGKRDKVSGKVFVTWASVKRRAKAISDSSDEGVSESAPEPENREDFRDRDTQSDDSSEDLEARKGSIFQLAEPEPKRPAKRAPLEREEATEEMQETEVVLCLFGIPIVNLGRVRHPKSEAAFEPGTGRLIE